MLAETQILLQNAQHSILFLQKEHAKTIEGLHTEIHTLQRKCSDLTFKIAIKGNSDVISHSNQGYSVIQGEAAIKELKILQEENIQLKGIIESRDKRIMLLEGQMKSKQHVNDSELKVVIKKLSELQNEVEQKSNLIAYLTTQLHQFKQKTANKSINNEKRRLSDVASPSPYDPAPPREGTPSKLRQRAFRRSLTSPVPQDSSSLNNLGSHQIAASQHILQTAMPKSSKNLPARPKQSVANPARPSHGFSSSRRERELNMFSKPKPSDYKEFLKSGRTDEVDLFPRLPVEPLPPISSTDTEITFANKDLGYIPSSRQKPRTRASRQGAKPAADIEKVIVEPLSSPEKGWRRTQDSKCSK